MLPNILILLPFAAAMLMLIIPKSLLKTISIVISLALIAVTAFAVASYQSGNSAILVSDHQWIASLGAKWLITLDGLSLLMCGMASIVTFLIFLSIRENDAIHNQRFFALAWMMIGAMMGVFIAKDGLLFYVFWELALIPIYFICLMWGGENRSKITFKFFIYTLFGSLFMLAALLYLHAKGTGNWDIATLYEAGKNLSLNEQRYIFWALFLGFAIKVPIFPFHTWQPDTYFTAPTQGTMLLSGIMLKMGTYGIARWLIPMVPLGVAAYTKVAMVLCIVGVIYASIIAITQKDIKRLFAWSSIAHVGLICAGLFAFNEEGIKGAFAQMLSHGINVVGLFFVVSIIANKYSTTEMGNMGGLRTITPKFALFYLIILLGSVALPLTNGFVGEFLLILGISKYNLLWAAFAGLTIILGAVYMLRSNQNVMLGEAKGINSGAKDVDTLELVIFIIFTILIFVFGIMPNGIFDLIHHSVDGLLNGTLGNMDITQ